KEKWRELHVLNLDPLNYDHQLFVFVCHTSGRASESSPALFVAGTFSLAKTAGLPRGIADAQDTLSMIQANCRARFTAADFDFVVRTLARSQTDHVSLVDLLGDAETRDAVLDNPRLIDAILSNAGQLQISSHFYFYVLARHVLRDAGITDRKLCDYVASLLEAFSHA